MDAAERLFSGGKEGVQERRASACRRRVRHSRPCLPASPARSERRFREEVFTSGLRTKESWTKWTTAGVCLHLDVVGL